MATTTSVAAVTYKLLATCAIVAAGDRLRGWSEPRAVVAPPTVDRSRDVGLLSAGEPARDAVHVRSDPVGEFGDLR